MNRIGGEVVGKPGYRGRVSEGAPSRVVGQYELCGVMVRGTMATLHYGRLIGPGGFSRAVAVKELHPEFAARPEFAAAFTEEVRLVSKVQHPNVVSILDIVHEKDGVFLVMEYVQGESLAQLLRAAVAARIAVPPPVASAIVSGILYGLHAAHEAKHPRHGPLGIVHRDLTTANVLIGVDGGPRVLDFGTATVLERLGMARPERAGGSAYRAPEQIQGREVTRQADVFAASVVLWETLTGRQLFEGRTAADLDAAILDAEIEAPSEFASTVTLELAALAGVPSHSTDAIDAVVLRGLSREPSQRFATAKEMAVALEQALRPATPSVVGEWVASLARPTLEEKAAILARLDTSLSMSFVLPMPTDPEVTGEPPTRPAPVPPPRELAPTLPEGNANVAAAEDAAPASRGKPVDRVYQGAVAIGVVALLVVVASLIHVAWTLLHHPAME